MTIVAAVLSQITWRRFLLAELCATLLIVEQWLGLDASERYGQYILDVGVTYSISALLFLIGALWADERVRRGAGAGIAYASALLPTSLLSGLVMTGLWFKLAWRNERSLALFLVENSVEAGLWGALAMLVFYNRSRADGMLQGVRQAELQYVQLERGLIDSRLEAARAQIDAPALFSDLAQIRELLRRDDEQATDKLDSLIRRLRESLGQRARPFDPAGHPQ